MLTFILWVIGVVLIVALAIVILVGIIKTIVRAAFSLLGIAALIWLVLFLMNTRVI